MMVLALYYVPIAPMVLFDGKVYLHDTATCPEMSTLLLT